MKRIFDLFFSGSALVLLSPVLIAVAIVVWLESTGPIIYRQKRVGRFGNEFQILKFRTMKVDGSNVNLQITLRNDSRITRIGGILRKYKLDELPQFVNVLFGDMSIVGPRPEVPRYVALYAPKDRETILSVRPGITDDASIKFSDESSMLADECDAENFYINNLMPAKIQLARNYVYSRSFIGDVLIVLKTVQVSLFGNSVRK